MNYTHDFILDCLKNQPIGETENFIWFITDIGIAALFKKNQNIKKYNLHVAREAKNISLDISKEEREYFEIKGKKLLLFYS